MCAVSKYLLRIFVIFIGTFQYTHAAYLICYRGSQSRYLVTPLDKPLMLASEDCIDRSLPTVFYTFGYRGRVNGPATTAVVGAYLATKKRNVILVDWEQEARSGLLGIPLGYVLYAVPNAKKVGEEMGRSLVQLARAGLNMTQVHLVGHSLGAHLMAYAGRRARETGFVVSRITGLDPARALFEGSLAVQSGLDRTCAKFVDIIHSDPGGYGTSKPSGSVDIWPNYAGTGSMQPGCPDGTFEMFTPEEYREYYPEADNVGLQRNITNIQKVLRAIQIRRTHLCSHDRSWRYFVEAIAAPTRFMAMAATGYEGWISTNHPSGNTIYMGDLTSTRARGNYFLSTGSKSPYGKGEEGMKPTGLQARKRRNSSLTRLLRYLR